MIQASKAETFFQKIGGKRKSTNPAYKVDAFSFLLSQNSLERQPVLLIHAQRQNPILPKCPRIFATQI